MHTFPWILIAFRFLWEAKTTLSIKLFCIIISWLDSDTHWDNSHCIQWKFRVTSISQHLTEETQTIKLLSYPLYGFKKQQQQPTTPHKTTIWQPPTTTTYHKQTKSSWTDYETRLKEKQKHIYIYTHTDGNTSPGDFFFF